MAAVNDTNGTNGRVEHQKIDHQAATPDSVPSQSSLADPRKYDEHLLKFKALGLPRTQQAWVDRAREVAAAFAEDVALRDIENMTPHAEVTLLKSAGLLKVVGPARYGGGEQGWDTGYKVIREVAKGDGSLGMLLGYHLLWSTTANVVGTEEEKARIQRLIIENNYFVGGAVNPRDSDLKITSDGECIVFNGYKNFNTGGVVSDLTILEGVYEGPESHIFSMVETKQPGIQFAHNWDNIGLRLTESGSVRIENVRVPWTDAFGWDSAAKRPLEHVLGIPFATLLLPTIQLVFANFSLGIAQGALSTAAAYTRTKTRAWPFAGNDPKSRASDEFYVLARYGSFHAHLAAAAALADRAGLDVAAGVFEVMGARATARTAGLDRFWRDIRTHTLHDPVAYKERELGRWVLLGEVPEPTWYT